MENHIQTWIKLNNTEIDRKINFAGRVGVVFWLLDHVKIRLIQPNELNWSWG